IRIAFSDPYFRTGQMALANKAVNRNYPKNFYALLGMSIVLKFGVVEGTTGEAYVRKNLGSAKEIIAYETSKIAVEKMLGGKIDLLVHDAPIILMLAAENEAKGLTPLPSLLTEEYLAWGIRKNDVELLKSANRFVAEMKKDGKLDSTIRRWIPYSE
ncbi:substrate-binding periplasmic protein, partial [Thermodesulfobacteriota bacterium]